MKYIEQWVGPAIILLGITSYGFGYGFNLGRDYGLALHKE
jgi:hypothetical protein